MNLPWNDHGSHAHRIETIVRGLIVVCATAAAASAQVTRDESATHMSATAIGQRAQSAFDITQVLWDTPGDGSTWARGATFKASFDADGATYIPFLGSRAPRDFPVRFHLAAVNIDSAPLAFDSRAEPVRTRDSIVYDRNGWVERYDLRLDAMEQLFVFDQLPSRGELVLRFDVESELDRAEVVDSAETAGGLELRNQFGTVRYGRAVAIDAAGERFPATTRFSEQGIEIRVASEFVQRAQLPLTIDPVVLTFAVDNTSGIDELPDVAYDVASTDFVVVFELAFSATDHDVHAARYTATGAPLGIFTIDVSTEYWATPRIANNANPGEFLFVATVGSPTGGARTINGRTYVPGNSVGVKFRIDPVNPNDHFHPDVGGDTTSTSEGLFCVVWQTSTPTTSSISGRLVSSSGALGLPFGTSSGGTIAFQNPAVARSNNLGPWMFVWEVVVAPSNHDIQGALINRSSQFVGGFINFDTSASDDQDPAVSAPLDGSLLTLVVYERANEIMGSVVDGNSVLNTTSLTALEAQVVPSMSTLRHVKPSVDTDGTQFTVGYTEITAPNPPEYDAFCATFSRVNNTLLVTEAHQALGTAVGSVETNVRLASRSSLSVNPRRFFATWSRGNDIEGALYDSPDFTTFCRPGLDTASCPCGNAPHSAGQGCNNSANTGGARLVASGSAAGDSVVLTATEMLPNSVCLFFQGSSATTAGITFGDGLRCASGTIKRMYQKTASGGAASAPAAGDPSIKTRSAAQGDVILPGTFRSYQVYYRDPANFACGASATFNLTNAVQVRW